MKRLEVRTHQVDAVARELAALTGQDPETIVFRGPPARINSLFGELYASPAPAHSCPFWQLFTPTARSALAAFGRLANIEIVEIAKEKAA